MINRKRLNHKAEFPNSVFVRLTYIFFSQSRHRKGNYAEYNDFSENEEWVQNMPQFFKFNLSKYLIPEKSNKISQIIEILKF